MSSFQSNSLRFALTAALAGFCSTSFAQSISSCDVIVAGGSTAALAAALTSARNGTNTCLLEPTDWAGGQLLSVPAIDIAWGKAEKAGFTTLDSSPVDRDPANLPPVFKDWMAGLRRPAANNNANCWVSGIDGCYLPVKSSFSAAGDKTLLTDFILPAIAAQPKLQVFYNTVVKRVTTQSTTSGRKKITSLVAIRRSPTPAAGTGYEKPLSADILDWYSATNSPRFNKSTLTFTSTRAAGAIFIDATELGDVLAVSSSAYTIGSENVEGDLEAAEACGQAIVYPFFMKYKATSGAAVENAPAGWTVPFPNYYQFNDNPTGTANWSTIWGYRRVANPANAVTNPAPGDHNVTALGNSISNQNWGPGNDYIAGYLFKGKAASSAEVSSSAGWQGGINVSVLNGAERHAIGWYYWLKARTPAQSAARITIGTELTGTSTGLTKFPYLRDTRRSMGIENFRLKTTDFIPENASLQVGRRFADRVALGSYPVDIHGVQNCGASYRKPAIAHPFPYYIPFRALTNVSTENLLVAGKTMSASFLANAATRLQPEEFASGQAAGAAASYMVKNDISSTSVAYQNITAVQNVTTQYTPNKWKIGSTLF
jgi:FAD dependent oxidoreductase